MEKNIELENKYVFKKDTSKFMGVAALVSKLCLDTKNTDFVVNEDIYYDDGDILEAYDITIRKRVNNEKVVYTIKRKVDGDIKKRWEINFSSLEEALLFLRTEWNLPINNLKEKLKLRTERTIFYYNFLGSLFEISLDETVARIEGIQKEPNIMIECELKKGNPDTLNILALEFKKFDFLEPCLESKKDIALKDGKPKKKKTFQKPSNIDASVLVPNDVIDNVLKLYRGK